MAKWYEELFRDYGRRYDEEGFTKGTLGEVDFIEKEIGHDKNIRVLDIGCGTGRHSIEMARRGYKVVGVDLSDSMLGRAKEKARAAHVKVEFLLGDARSLNFREEFGLVMMVCEGAFPLMETDRENFEILRNAAKALMPGGKLVFTTLNGLFPLFHSVKDFINSGATNCKSDKNTFDLMTFRDHSEYTGFNDHGREMTLKCNERYYVPSEISWLLDSLGFSQVDILGCQIGDWSRERKLSHEDFEMLVVAMK